MRDLNRRRVLRGMLNGSAVTVGLPLLDCFLNGNGTALASGEPMPMRLGTWFWGLGGQDKVFRPKATGRDYDLPDEIASFKPIQGDMNLITNLTTYRDALPNVCHHTGWMIMRAGEACPTFDDRPGQTFDITIANQIGRVTRFPHLTASAAGDTRRTVSYESVRAITVPETDVLNFYTRLFGPGFHDPNAPDFVPSASAMVRKSVLSGVAERTKKLMSEYGASDRERLDEYFTGVRHLERQIEQELKKPTPNAACRPAGAPDVEATIGVDSVLVSQRHRLLTELMAMAVTCDQTRVLNMFYSASQANTNKAGYDKPHHTTTHEERLDEQLGIQPISSWYTRRAMEEWVAFIQAFKNIKEGDGSLLDNMLIVGTTDHGNARIHSLDGMMAFTAGRLGGKVKTGLHIAGEGRQGTILGLTVMRLMGLDKRVWGTGSNTTSKELSEILV